MPPTDRVVTGVVGQFELLALEREEVLATVFAARHVSLERRVTVKCLRPELVASPEATGLFLAEARVTSRIGSAHVPAILDIGEAGQPYYVMERVAGRSLAELLAIPGRLPLPRALHIARGIGEALDAAHAEGIIHRDLRPRHVELVTRQADPDFVKLLGFGQPPPDADDPAYRSPEQCCGADARVDARADQYALGAILYHMLAGQPPFPDASLGEILLAHLTRQPPSLREHVADLPDAIEAVVGRALQKDPAARFGSVRELLDALSPSAPPPAVAPPRIEVVAASELELPEEQEAQWRPPLGVRKTTTLAIVVALAISTLGVSLVWSRSQPAGSTISAAPTGAAPLPALPLLAPPLAAPPVPAGLEPGAGSAAALPPPHEIGLSVAGLARQRRAPSRVPSSAKVQPHRPSAPRRDSIPLLGYPE